MFKKLILGIGIAAIGCCGGLPASLLAQCSTGNCGQSYDQGTAFDDSSYESCGSEFLQNVGTGQFFRRVPGCNDGSCPQTCCPAVCCGPYVSAFGGWTNISDFSRFQDLGTQQVQIGVDGMGDPIFEEIVSTAQRFMNTDGGFSGGLAIGKQVHSRARMELEATYRENDFQSYQVQSFVDNILMTDVITPTAGDLQSYSIMGNLHIDLNPRCLNRPNIYAGVGVGLLILNGTAASAADILEVAETAFAFQVIGGVNRPITNHLEFFLEYRYLVADHIDVTNTTTGISLGDFNFRTNNVYLGLRLRR